MFSCPLHNWFSYDFPCPACQKQMSSTTEIIINAEGTSTEHLQNKCETYKQLQSLLADKDKEILKWKELYEAACETYKEVEEENDQLTTERDHYKALAEAGEFVMNFMKFDNTSYPECVEEDFERYKKANLAYQNLKNQTPDKEQRIIEGL